MEPKKRVAFVQLCRYGDIVSMLPMAWFWHTQGYKVDIWVKQDFADILSACSYVRARPVDTHDRAVEHIHRMATETGEYDHVFATQVDGNPFPIQDDGVNFIVQQWIRGGMLSKFHDLPLVMDVRDRENERLAFQRRQLIPDTKQPILVYCGIGHSSPFYKDHSHPDRSDLEMEKFLREATDRKWQFVDIGGLKLPHPQYLLGVLEKATALVSIDSLPIHLAYATQTPTIVLSRDSRWYMSEPRSHWMLHETYGSSLSTEGRKRIADTLDLVYDAVVKGIGDCKVPRIEIKPIEAMKRERVFHVVDYWMPPEPHKDRPRLLGARRSWEQVMAKDRAWHMVYHEAKTAKRSARDLGDDRDLPYITDVFDYGVGQARKQQPKGDPIVCFTNADIGLCPEAPDVVRRAAAVAAFGFARRREVTHMEKVYTVNDLRVSEDHPGSDLFFFRCSWWEKNKSKFPDLCAAEGWDFVLRHIMLKQNPGCQIMSCIYHGRHKSEWSSGDNINTAPSQLHNRRLCTKWAKDNGMANALLDPTQSRFLFKNDESIAKGK